MYPTTIISGAQTGADRGGLDAAIALGLAHGGWVPKGRRAEDGIVPARYEVREMQSPDYGDRTRRNVIAADGTVLFTIGPPMGGSKLTLDHAVTAGKPVLHLELGRDCTLSKDAADLFRGWLVRHEVRILNVAGSRESGAPGIHAAVRDFLVNALKC